MATTVTDILLTAVDAAERAKVHVEWERDPKVPGRTGYRLRGARRECVQAHIDDLVRRAEDMNGFANFVGPHRIDGGYGALGEVIVQPELTA